MTRTASISAVLVLAGALALGAPERVVAQDAPAEVTYRQNIMQAIRTNLMQLRAVGAVEQPTHTVYYARALYGLGEMLGDAFRDGSAASSGSLATVWQDRAGFEEHVGGFQMATAQLLEAAEMRDAAAIQRGVQAVGGTCSSCHQAYRAPN